ncbi:MAG TPA: sugar phosphate isomerase/epimerase [Acidobacteriota bacterium]|nr:sugar phosphate isomerase/epimerase [Acidobacteriota bacterium]
MPQDLRLALNADTTPLSISDTLVFKPFQERAREAADAGYPAVNLDRQDGLTPEGAKETASRLGVGIASGFFHAHFHVAEIESTILKEAREQAEFSRDAGQDCLFVSAFVSPPERHALAGRIRPDTETALTRPQMERMGRVLEKVARLWKGYGITLCFHPHVATYVEAPHEIDLLMSVTSPDLVRVGLDTGHLYFGGADPLEMIERYFDRLDALHIKDVRADVVERARREKWNYRQACAQGVWTELGQGDINFAEIFGLLRRREWGGWVIVETDHTTLPTALQSSIASRRFLRDKIGI